MSTRKIHDIRQSGAGKIDKIRSSALQKPCEIRQLLETKYCEIRQSVVGQKLRIFSFRHRKTIAVFASRSLGGGGRIHKNLQSFTLKYYARSQKKNREIHHSIIIKNREICQSVGGGENCKIQSVVEKYREILLIKEYTQNKAVQKKVSISTRVPFTRIICLKKKKKYQSAQSFFF